MKNKILTAYNAIIAGLLSILGFAPSCDSRVEYGTPAAKFIVNGNVKSSETEQPVGNIRVSLLNDTSYTGSDGTYHVVDNWGFPAEQVYHIKFQDIDGAANGEFSDIDTVVEFKNPEFTGGDGDWYAGETSKEFDVKLTPKK